MNLIFYGLIFVGAGVWKLIRERRARCRDHAHRCPACGTTWTHKTQCWPTVRAYADAHTCPKCGTEQFEIGKMPLNAGGAAQRAAVPSVATATASSATGGGLRPERPAPSPKDRDTADHGAGPALPEKKPA